MFREAFPDFIMIPISDLYENDEYIVDLKIDFTGYSKIDSRWNIFTKNHYIYLSIVDLLEKQNFGSISFCSIGDSMSIDIKSLSLKIWLSHSKLSIKSAHEESVFYVMDWLLAISMGS